jgi:adenylate kinase family enzyme
MIFGRPGSGKSTFALKLHKLTHIPLHHLDKHFYESNWVERDYHEFLGIQQSIIDNASWIIDGNSTKSLEIRYAKADLALYFNFPRFICYVRIFKRWFDKDPNIDDRAKDCKEVISYKLLRYMWSFEKRVAMKLIMLKQKYPCIDFFEIRSNSDLNILIKRLFDSRTVPFVKELD